MLDSFFDLKMGNDLTSANKSSTKSKDGIFTISVDTQDFDPEDLDILVEGQCLIIKGEREIKRGNNVSKRVFNQKFDLPKGVEVEKITSEYKLDGKLIVSPSSGVAKGPH